MGLIRYANQLQYGRCKHEGLTGSSSSTSSSGGGGPRPVCWEFVCSTCSCTEYLLGRIEGNRGWGGGRNSRVSSEELLNGDTLQLSEISALLIVASGFYFIPLFSSFSRVLGVSVRNIVMKIPTSL